VRPLRTLDGRAEGMVSRHIWYYDLDPGPPPRPAVRWNIGRQGRAWTGDEARERWELTPEKFELDRGKLFWDETQRLTLLALLLEKRRRRPGRAAG
jgi:hypothetical protein